MRRFPALLLLVALLWHAIGPAGLVDEISSVQRWLHEDLHALQAEHHHHHDGSVHEEDAGGTSHHAHPAFDLTSALLTTEWSGTDVRGARVGPMASHPRYAGPALAGPLRPPQAA